jgi:hypothetical protein
MEATAVSAPRTKDLSVGTAAFRPKDERHVVRGLEDGVASAEVSRPRYAIS